MSESKRYSVSHEGYDRFNCTVNEKNKEGISCLIICACFDGEDAQLICDALNEKEERNK